MRPQLREAAKNFGLIGHEKPGKSTPATLVLAGQRWVRLSTLNQGQKCHFARDTLEDARAMKQESVPRSITAPRVESPKPGLLFAKALVNKAAALMFR